jgi:hypothetical protein
MIPVRRLRSPLLLLPLLLHPRPHIPLPPRAPLLLPQKALLPPLHNPPPPLVNHLCRMVDHPRTHSLRAVGHARLRKSGKTPRGVCTGFPMVEEGVEDGCERSGYYVLRSCASWVTDCDIRI